MPKKRKNDVPASFPFFPDDWLGSSKVAVMTLAEQGAYIRLLAHQWNDPTCTLPDDDAKLAALSGFGPEWPAHSASMREAFVPHRTKGRVHNEKLSQKRAELMSFKKKASERGKHGADSRWKGTGHQDVNAEPTPQASPKHRDASGMPQASPEQCSPMAPRSPVPGPLSPSIKRGGKDAAAPPSAGADQDRPDPNSGAATPAADPEGRLDSTAPPSKSPEIAGEDAEVRLSVDAFDAFLVPGRPAKENAVRDLRRQGVSHERIRASARANAKAADFFAVFDQLRNGRAVEPALPTSAKPQGPKCATCDGVGQVYVSGDTVTNCKDCRGSGVLTTG